MKWSRWTIGLMSFLWLVPGCTLHIGGDGYGDAVLVVEWSIEGSFDPDQCDHVGADELEMFVFDRFGDFVLEAQIDCEAGGMEVRLDEGLYDLEFRLVDRRDNSVSDVIEENRVQLRDYRDRLVSIDFPSSTLL